jgi:hypothetical protein
VDELVTEFRKHEERQSCLEKPGMRVCDLIIGPPSGWAWLADWLEEAAEHLGVE